jgi:hypothetical protein
MLNSPLNAVIFRRLSGASGQLVEELATTTAMR